MSFFSKYIGVQKSNVYGDIYPPYYNTSGRIDPDIPDIYNKLGDKMDIFFIRDSLCAHGPYINKSKYFLWDRFNIGLKTHFYTHKSMLEKIGNPDNCYGLFIEPRTISPQDYKIFDKHKGLEKDFTAILTFDEILLNKLPNAKFFPYCANVCYGKDVGCDIKLSDKVYETKNKNISIVCSNKKFTKHQKLRQKCAYIVKNEKLGDTFGQFDGSARLEFKADSLKDYRYQIAVENGVFDYYFTEKILDCFASMTVPIYLGAPKIGDYFNMDGIIVISEKDIDNLPKIVQQCNESDYKSRLPAIKENYLRALKHVNLDDYLYETVFIN